MGKVSKILMIDHPLCERIDIAGGKGSMVHQMRKKFPELFPNAFIIPCDAELTAELLPEIASCMQLLVGVEKYAVRSSALMEDMSQYSFAGQYVSVLNVSGAENVLAAARQVRDSIHTPLVQSYLKTRGIVGDTLNMSVLVMPMVGDEEHTVSGVIFMSDVESGLPDIYSTASVGNEPGAVTIIADGTLIQSSPEIQYWIRKVFDHQPVTLVLQHNAAIWGCAKAALNS